MIAEALGAILFGGGTVGVLFGWLLTRWLDARRLDGKGTRKPVTYPEATAAELYPPPPVVPPPGGLPPPDPFADWHAAVERIHAPAPGLCAYTTVGHRCSLPRGHEGPHVCDCSAIPVKHYI